MGEREIKVGDRVIVIAAKPIHRPYYGHVAPRSLFSLGSDFTVGHIDTDGNLRLSEEGTYAVRPEDVALVREEDEESEGEYNPKLGALAMRVKMRQLDALRQQVEALTERVEALEARRSGASSGSVDPISGHACPSFYHFSGRDAPSFQCQLGYGHPEEHHSYLLRWTVR